MQSPQEKRKNFIDILSDSAEPQRAHALGRSLTSNVIAFIGSLWARWWGVN